MNAALTSHLQYESHDLLVRRANYKILQIALVAAGYEENRFAVLEPACQTNLVVVEKRKAEWVQVYLNALAAKVDLETFPDINDCELGAFDDAVPAGNAATLTTAITGTNNDLKFTANRTGAAGNLIQIQYFNPGVASQSLGVSLTGSLIKISLGTNSSNVIVSTANQVLSLINNSSTAGALVTAALAPSNDGSGVMVALAPTNLAGGSDF